MKRKLKTAHTPNTKKGMGDYYGSGIPAKVGRVRDISVNDVVKPSKLKKPPKSLA